MANFGWLSGSLGKGSPIKGQVGDITVILTEIWSSSTTKGGMDRGGGQEHTGYGRTHEYVVMDKDGHVLEHGYAKGDDTHAKDKASKSALKFWKDRERSIHIDRSEPEAKEGPTGGSGGSGNKGDSGWNYQGRGSGR